MQNQNIPSDVVSTATIRTVTTVPTTFGVVAQAAVPAAALPSINSVATTVSNPENTMNAYAATSMAMFLLKLASKYLPTTGKDEIFARASKEKQEEIMDRIIQNHITTFQQFIAANQRQLEELGITSQDIDEINEYIELLSHMEIIKAFDTVTVFIQGQGKGKEIKRAFPLKEVFALVCAATLDSEAYLKGGTDGKREESNKMHRVLILIKTLKDLRQHPRCHQGTRHELVGVLNEVYPEAHFIDDVSALFKYIALEVLTEKLQQETEQKQFEIFCEWVRSEGDIVTAFFKINAEAVRAKLKAECLKHGIRHQGMVQKIEETIENLIFLAPPVDLHKNAIPVKTILDGTGVIWDAAQTQLRQVSTFAAVPQSVLDLTTVNDIFQHCKKLHSRAWGTEEADIVENLITLCEDYFSNATPEKLPAIVKTYAILKPFLMKVEPDFDFITNFFARFSLLGDEDRARMYMRLLQQKQEIILSDDEIRKVLNPASPDGIINIDSYQISRTLLHAILVSPAEWSPKFYDLFFAVINFITAGLSLPENDPRRTGFNYYQEYLSEFQLLKVFYLRCKNFPQELPAIDPYMAILPNLEGLQGEGIIGGPYKKQISLLQKIYVIGCNYEEQGLFFVFGVRNHLSTINLWSSIVGLLPAIKRMPFLKTFEMDFVRSEIRGSQQLIDVLCLLPDEETIRNLLLSFGGLDFVDSKIENANKLVHILHHIREDKRMEFLKSLGRDFVRNKIEDVDIENGNPWPGILVEIPENNTMEFLNFLGLDFVCSKIKNCEELAHILSYYLTPKEKQMELLNFLGLDFVRSKIEDGEQLRIILHYLIQENTMDFLLNFMGLSFVRSKIKNGHELLSILYRLPGDERMVGFLKSLGRDFVLSKIEDGDSWIDILHQIPENNMIGFLDFVGLNFVRSKIVDGEKLLCIVSRVHNNNRMDFLNFVGLDFIREKLKNSDDKIDGKKLEDFLSNFPEGIRGNLKNELLSVNAAAILKAPSGSAAMFQPAAQPPKPKEEEPNQIPESHSETKAAATATTTADTAATATTTTTTTATTKVTFHV